MRLQQRTIGRAVVFDIEGEIDLFNTSEIKQSLQQAIAANQFRIIVNMERVAYIDSTGIGVFLSVLKTLRDSGGDLKLAALSPAVEKVFQLTRLNGFFQVHPDIETAERAFS